MDWLWHVDVHLNGIIAQFGPWTYLILFLIIFCETGLVVTPILPGDSLLFAAGTFAARGALNPHALFGLLTVAAVAGDTVNYWIGHFFGERVLAPLYHGVTGLARSRFVNQEHLAKTQRFYERHGGKTIVLARFMPIIRTFAPFVAGIARMRYPRFLTYNVFGGVAWIAIFTYGGYAFGNLTFVQRHFLWVIAAIVVISFMPGMLEVWRARTAPGASRRTAPPPG